MFAASVTGYNYNSVSMCRVVGFANIDELFEQ